VQAQTEKNIEILVVDDRSTDDTEQIVKQSGENIRYITNKHAHCPAGARNQGAEEASGEYLAFLDSDDEWAPRHLEDSLYFLDKHCLNASYALWHRLRGSLWEGYPQEWLDIFVNDLGLKVDDGAILLGSRIAEYVISKPFWCFHTDTLVAKRDAVLKCGAFDERFFSAEDLEFSFRLLLGNQACLIKDYHASYYEGDDNIVALRKEDPEKTRIHNANMVMAFKQIEKEMESSSSIVDKVKCRDQIAKKIAKYEILR